MLYYTGNTQKNGAILIVNTIKTAPFVCVCPVYMLRDTVWPVKQNSFICLSYDRPIL